MANLTLRKSDDTNLPARVGVPSLLGNWDPFRIMESLLRWDPFQDMPWAGRNAGQLFMPHFEVKETGDSYVFKADLPGVKESDIDISLTGNQITISGKREEERQEDVTYYAYERSYGSFTRTFTLPQGADTEQVRADLKDGVLTLVVRKRPEVQPRKIALGTDDKGNKASV